ncbi:MAG: nucleotide pyrophosphohydrolase [SAR202 cluster bacterium]|nr:nucleotide pyrophosphohydrolase [SAR202 cluster bacterium]
METARLQDKVAAFVKRHGLDAGVEARLLDLVSEAGELSKEALKGSAYGKKPFAPTGEWTSEMGDVLFSLAALANATGVDLEVALDEALAKYEARLAEKGDVGSGR